MDHVLPVLNEVAAGLAGRDWGQEEKGTTEDEMAGWHHQLDVHEFECPQQPCDVVSFLE